MRTIIVGAGIAGLAAAQRLADLGSHVTVVERASGPRNQGYMIDFFGPGYEAAQRMGLLARLRELGYHVERFSYVDEHGRIRASMDYQRFEKAASGAIVSIMRPDLERALREAVDGRVDLRYSVTVEAIDNRPDGVSVTLSDGSALDADLLIGADGIHSATRAATFGPEQAFLRFLGLHTAAFVFDDPVVHDQVQDGFFLTDSVDVQMGFYGLRDGRVAAFTVHRTSDPELPADPRAAVLRTYQDLGWLTARALGLCPSSADVYYDQVAQIEMDQWVNRRVVLLGDSAYAVSLLAGQGASLAVAGAYVLGRQLATTPDIDRALAEYVRRWHPVVTQRQLIGRRGASWFLPASTTQLRLRRLAVTAMRLPGLDRWLGTALVGKNHTPIDTIALGTT
ncbi:FAD-dependent monooxygenase [Hamadaea sp. NPDC051192]|uniref:FAD-dependent monooxygenase n=1 Tax=Hamadaea sp. NPDC051192 TaxID=3154940 RepID=UPI003418BA64